MMNGTGTDSAHIALDSDCFSNVTPSTLLWTPACTRLAATIAVEPPTEPAVCTRSSGLPTAPSASARNSSGVIPPSKKSGAFPATAPAVDVSPADPGISPRPVDRLPAQPGHRDVRPLRLVMGLAGAEHGRALL